MTEQQTAWGCKQRSPHGPLLCRSIWMCQYLGLLCLRLLLLIIWMMVRIKMKSFIFRYIFTTSCDEWIISDTFLVEISFQLAVRDTRTCWRVGDHQLHRVTPYQRQWRRRRNVEGRGWSSFTPKRHVRKLVTTKTVILYLKVTILWLTFVQQKSWF